MFIVKWGKFFLKSVATLIILILIFTGMRYGLAFGSAMLSDFESHKQKLEDAVDSGIPVIGRINSSYYYTDDDYTFSFKVTIGDDVWTGSTTTNVMPDDFERVTLYYLPTTPVFISIDPEYELSQWSLLDTSDTELGPAVFTFLVILTLLLVGLHSLWSTDEDIKRKPRKKFVKAKEADVNSGEVKEGSRKAEKYPAPKAGNRMDDKVSFAALCPNCNHSFTVRADAQKVKSKKGKLRCSSCKHILQIEGAKAYYLVLVNPTNSPQGTGWYGDSSGPMTHTWADGTRYVGGFNGEEKDGKGTMVWSNGDVYVGDWKSGIREGKGVLTWADGTKYDGDWEGDNRHGRGSYTYPDGSQSIGQWRDDEQI